MPQTPASRAADQSPFLDATSPAAPSTPVAHRAASSYTPPTVTVLGSLASLTQGGVDFPDDGSGGAGATGSI